LRLPFARWTQEEKRLDVASRQVEQGRSDERVLDAFGGEERLAARP
jgi:hypothetical protein